jgi:hypothetical protein
MAQETQPTCLRLRAPDTTADLLRHHIRGQSTVARVAIGCTIGEERISAMIEGVVMASLAELVQIALFLNLPILQLLRLTASAGFAPSDVFCSG